MHLPMRALRKESWRASNGDGDDCVVGEELWVLVEVEKWGLRVMGCTTVIEGGRSRLGGTSRKGLMGNRKGKIGYSVRIFDVKASFVLSIEELK